MKTNRIYLSPPHQTGDELEALQKVLSSNWLAPAGPELAQFEQEICKVTGFKYAVVTSSATAALHLGLKVLGVGEGDTVLTSTLTFIGAVNPIVYQGAKPVFVDSLPHSWNIDPEIIKEYLASSSRKARALVPTHLYGMPADVIELEEISRSFDIPILHDLAECLGGKVNKKKIGKLVSRGILSFNGNKLITTSGGGAYVTNVKEEAERVLYLATQAKSNHIAYHHESVGYNYRMSNVLAALGNAQIKTFEQRLEKKKEIFVNYKNELEPLGFSFQKEPEGIESDRWLTVALFNRTPDISAKVREMEQENIEVRPLWKPMHLQPVFKQEKILAGSISANLFTRGLCLPSGCGLTESQQERVIHHMKALI